MRIKAKGFTFIEVIIVLGIMGILALAAYPSIRNAMEVRGLEGSARDILTTLQASKFQAVNKKINHRVRFFQSGTDWAFLPEYVPKLIPSQFTVTISLPDNNTVVYSPTGFVANYSNAAHSVSLVSPKVAAQGKPSQRLLTIYAGGSIEYSKL
jgi:prepilin-type N-terminal cleavage/methylation domain-containing protein